MAVEFLIPGRLPKIGGNDRLSWRALHIAKMKARDDAFRRCKSALGRSRPALPVAVSLTYRFSGPTPDDDNVTARCKAARDGIAEALGVNDGDRRAVTWHYDQERVPRADMGLAVRVEQRRPAPCEPSL